MPHPFGDLGVCIVGELGGFEAITVRRRPAGAYDTTPGAGKFVRGAETSTATSAVVQPSTPKEVEKLPENERTKEAITLYTIDALVASDVSAQRSADLIDWQGRTYEVQRVEDWTSQAKYALAIATRVGV